MKKNGNYIPRVTIPASSHWPGHQTSDFNLYYSHSRLEFKSKTSQWNHLMPQHRLFAVILIFFCTLNLKRKQWARYMGQESNSEKQQPKQKRGHSTDYKLGEAAHQLNEPPKPNLQHFNFFLLQRIRWRWAMSEKADRLRRKMTLNTKSDSNRLVISLPLPSSHIQISLTMRQIRQWYHTNSIAQQGCRMPLPLPIPPILMRIGTGKSCMNDFFMVQISLLCSIA